MKALHWFNPFVYIASRRASFYCEELCDSVVLKDSDENGRKEYGHTIIDVIGQSVAPQTSLCISMSSKKSDLKERIRNILNSGQGKRSLALTFAVTFAALVLCAFSSIQYEEVFTPIQASEPVVSIDSVPTPTFAPVRTENDVPAPTRTTNILIAGMDGFYLTDVIMVANFNAETNRISLLSFPRDTYLAPTDDTKSKAERQGFHFPDEMKINQLTAYSEGSMDYLQSEISDYLGISIDYYVKMDMSAFEKIVDATGGVDIELPRDYYYKDPEQDLEIDLKAGMQRLDGEKALQYIRYRADYRNGDLDRIGVQQQFLKELYRKAVNGDNLLEKASAIIAVLVNYTETNMTISDLTPYLLSIPKLKADSLQAFIPSANAGRFGNNMSCVFLDRDELEGFVADNFR